MTEVDKLLAYFGKRIVYVNGTATITREMVEEARRNKFVPPLEHTRSAAKIERSVAEEIGMRPASGMHVARPRTPARDTTSDE